MNTMTCYNCSRHGHSAIYCPNAPQRLRRCERCWAAARSPRDHASFCSNKSFVSPVLDEYDDAHSSIVRFVLTSSIAGDSIRRADSLGKVSKTPSAIGVRYSLPIANAIELEWIRGESVFFEGPKTMFFRVFVTSGKMILLKIDVLFDSCKIMAVNEHINHSSELKGFQVAAVLAIKPKPQQIFIKINDDPSQVRHLSFETNEDGLILTEMVFVNEAAEAGMVAEVAQERQEEEEEEEDTERETETEIEGNENDDDDEYEYLYDIFK